MIKLKLENKSKTEFAPKTFVACPHCGHEDYFFHYPPLECVECKKDLITFGMLENMEARVEFHRGKKPSIV